jgi:hypothetical protein
MSSRISVLLAVATLLVPSLGKAAEPATTAEAAEKLDLETLPIPEGAKLSSQRRVAELSYTIKKSTKAAFSFVEKQLQGRGWKPLTEGQSQGGLASTSFQREGFTVHLAVFSQGFFESHVLLTHKGNVDLKEVPMPANAEKMYDFPGISMLKSPDSVEETTKACRELMLKAGWSPYGGAGDSTYFRKNAMQVNVNVMSAPGQGGATVISLSSTMLSLELPAPSFTDNFRYDDSTSVIGFDTDKTPQEVADYYREQLTPVGWKTTTDKPVKIKWKEYTIFRNAGQEMITIATHEFEGRTRVNLDHQNATEVAIDELKGKIAAGEKAKYRDVKWLPVTVAIPAGLKAEKLEDWAVKIPTPGKDAFAVAEAIEKALTAEGWTYVGN